jgi:hypothetical protein
MDPDYRWLLADIAARDQLRRQTRVSLNLKFRRDERTRIEQERMARENARRTARGLPLAKSAEDLDADDGPDAVLEQSAWVLTDLVASAARPSPTTTADRKP